MLMYGKLLSDSETSFESIIGSNPIRRGNYCLYIFSHNHGKKLYRTPANIQYVQLNTFR